MTCPFGKIGKRCDRRTRLEDIEILICYLPPQIVTETTMLPF